MYDTPSDQELWGRIVKHDGVAFGQLFDRHSQAVYNHCFRRTASWSSAEELTSIVWAEVWRRRKDVRLQSDSILPWLLAVANNCLRNLQRSQRRHRNLLTKLPPATVADFTDAAVGRFDDERTMVVVLAALSDLSVEDQDVIALCDWAELSYAEAATALNIPIGTVRSRLSRAHDRLRNRLVVLPSDTHALSATHFQTTPTEKENPNDQL